jgi:protein-disulfide isomerase
MDAPELPTREHEVSGVSPVRATSWRAILDVTASTMMIAAAAVLLWTAWPRTIRVVRPAPPLPQKPVSLADTPALGTPGAKVAIIEFSDFECPFCGRFDREIRGQIQSDYVASGKAIWAFKHLPLPMHPFALRAAQAAECAGMQGRFWEMHDLLFRDQHHLDDDSLQLRAAVLNLNRDRFTACVRGEASKRITRDMADAQAYMVNGTPTFLVGVIQADGQVRVSRILTGAVSRQEFQRVLDSLLSGV